MTFCDLLKFLSQVSKFLQMTSFDFILFSFDFVRIFFVLGKRNIKIVQKYIFTLIFNKSRLRTKKNRTNFRWVK